MCVYIYKIIIKYIVLIEWNFNSHALANVMK